MGLLERIGDVGARLVTIDLDMTHLTEVVSLMREELKRPDQKVSGLEHEVGDLRERVTRLEAGREADRAQLETQITRFQLEVERAQIQAQRTLPPLP
jgi:predicted  nucleic acid-binding Zn-ribbon protein